MASSQPMPKQQSSSHHLNLRLPVHHPKKQLKVKKQGGDHLRLNPRMWVALWTVGANHRAIFFRDIRQGACAQQVQCCRARSLQVRQTLSWNRYWHGGGPSVRVS